MVEGERRSDLAAPMQTRAQFGSRTALMIGFGALLILLAVMSIDSLRMLEAFEANNAQIRQDFLFRERTLDQVRTGLYESSNVMRDYVATRSNPAARETLRAELESIRNDTTSALTVCIQSLPSEKRRPFEHLGEELEKYWSIIEPVLALGAQQKQRQQDDAVLRRDLLSQHAELLAITKEVSAVNDADLRDADRNITEACAQFRRRLLTVATFALTLGLVLAAATILYVRRLEKSVEIKYHESLRAQGDLKALSKRLVDAEERERRAISRELHDEVGQSLSALLLDVENLSESSEGGSFRQSLQNIKMLAENCVNEVRNMALLLRPSMLNDLGLVPALEWQAREVSKRTGMVVDTFEENVSDNLPEEHKTCVYRIVQEALNNCSKHAYAKNVRVAVRQEPNKLQLSIEDDGKGFDPARVRGLGLVGMNERVSQLGGVLKLESDRRGTRVLVDLPLPSMTPGRNN